MSDPRWFYVARFTDGTRMTFYADTKILAHDHAMIVGQHEGKRVLGVTRVKHAKDVSPVENAAAGRFF